MEPIHSVFMTVLFIPVFAFKAAFNLARDHATSHCISQGFNYQMCLLGFSSSVLQDLQKVLNNQQRLFLAAPGSDTNLSREAFVKNLFYYTTCSFSPMLVRSLTFSYPSLILILMRTSPSVKLTGGLLVQPEDPKLYLSYSSLAVQI